MLHSTLINLPEGILASYKLELSRLVYSAQFRAVPISNKAFKKHLTVNCFEIYRV